MLPADQRNARPIYALATAKPRTYAAYLITEFPVGRLPSDRR